MAEKIVNGDFTPGVENWSNGPEGQPFGWESGIITSSSNSDNDDEVTHCIQQEFNISQVVLEAKLTAWNNWDAYVGGIHNGTVQNKIWLRKPDASWVTIKDETHSGETGSGYLATAEDITAHFSQMGNYLLRLYSNVTASKHIGPPIYYRQAFGAFDDVSLLIKSKLTKTVNEAIGNGELTQKETFVEKTEYCAVAETATKMVKRPRGSTEYFALAESYVKKTMISVLEKIGLREFYDTSTALARTSRESLGIKETVIKKIKRILTNSVGIKEGTAKKVKRPPVLGTEIAGLGESLTSKWKKSLIPDSAGLGEFISAVLTLGTVVVNITIDDLMAWTSPAARTTYWRIESQEDNY